MAPDADESLWGVLERNLTQSETSWLEESGVSKPLELMTAFVAAPRFLANRPVATDAEAVVNVSLATGGLAVDGWDTVRLGRVWLLGKFAGEPKAEYIRHIETLLDTAEMNELVALYSVFPLLEYGEQWLFRATDAVRSNMGVVFDAIALGNPYPRIHFSESAWNQLVLKTIFNNKPIHRINGLDERANESLAFMLSDFAHERWSAGRSVAPGVWRLVPKFLNDQLLRDMERLFISNTTYEPEAAALVCFHSENPKASQLLNKFPELSDAVRAKKIAWTQLEFS